MYSVYLFAERYVCVFEKVCVCVKCSFVFEKVCVCV